MSSRREFHVVRPELPSPIKVAAICSVLLAAGAGIIVWVSLDPQGPLWPASAQRVMAYVIAALLVVVSIAVFLLDGKRRRRVPDQAPELVLDEQGFTAWGGLRVRWLDVTSWEVFHHNTAYDDDVPEGHPDYTGPTQVDEFLILVHVDHPEALLRRLAPDVRAAYEDDAFGDDERFSTPIRIGADGLDAPTDEVITEFERYSKTPPRSR
ncbi:hypothetical protein ACIG47_13150 [Promicromonospora sp. NPDC052451]|uniref:hypothetical protein n=1 Tax=Promicromonospora sp. NPDC052451 TaxID=3364407 RepID=UPI0037C85240